MSDAARLESLEVKCAYLEHATQELSDALYRQQQALDRALARIEDLARQLEAGKEAAADAARPADPRAEVPPHY